MAYRMGSNALALILGNLVTAASHAIVGVAAARFLPASEFGRYAIAISASILVIALTDGGLGLVAMKELGRQRGAARSLARVTFIARLLLIASVTAVALAIAPVVWSSPESAHSFAIGVAIGAVGSLSTLCRAFFAGFGSLWKEAVLQTGERLLILALVLPALDGGAAVPILVATLFGRMAGLLSRAAVLLAEIRRITADVRVPIGRIVRAAAPLAVAVVFASIYFNVDVLLLGGLAGEQEAGHYQAVVQILLLVYLIPESVSIVLVPALSSARARDEQAMIEHIKRSLHKAAPLGGLAAVALIALGPSVITLLYPNLSDLSLVIRLLALACLFRFGSYVLSAAMPALGREGTRAVAAVAATVTNVSLNLLLIPRFGAAAAAAVTVATEALLFAVYFRALWREFPGAGWTPVVTSVAAGAGAAAILWALLVLDLAPAMGLFVAIGVWEIAAIRVGAQRPSAAIAGFIGDAVGAVRAA